jgi:glycopeptide antibiotics resistance protein
MRSTYQRAFVVYLIVVAAVTIIPTHISRLRSPHSEHVNLFPLYYTIRCIQLAYRIHHDLMGFCLRNTLGNIALFLPLGFLLPLGFDRYRTLKRVMAVAFFLSLSIEAIQFVSRFIGSPRAVDVDDVLLNTLGACLGFAIYRYIIQRKGGNMGRG